MRRARVHRAAAAATAFSAASSSDAGRHRSRLRARIFGLLGVGADDPHDHRYLAGLLRARLDEAPGDLIASGDAAEDVDQDRLARSGRRG